jgi:hypothetical protein
MSELYRAKYYATQQEMIADLDRHIAEQDRIITAYQIAKDNLEVRFLRLMCDGPTESEYELYASLNPDRSLAVKRPAQVY